MTRINIGIKPQQLTDEHLLAEHREIKRLADSYQKAVKSGSIDKIPDTFTLGRGHVLFFLNKFGYILERYIELFEEAYIAREFKVGCYIEVLRTVPIDRYSRKLRRDIPNGLNYTPTQHDRQLLTERITERIQNSPKKYWHYYGKRITPQEAINLLNN